jgi:hypothetical protein
MIELYIRRLAGILVLAGLVLGYFVNPYWFILSAFVAVNLLQSSFTKFCPVESLFKKIIKNP